jgi:SAM-dependent methyltransferase
MNVDKKSVARFSDRVADYVRYRPSYPVEALDAIRSIGELRAGANVADLGSGTGIWTRILLEAGFYVSAVEPNPEMRRVAEGEFGSHSGFRSVDGASDSTSLSNGSVDLVTAAQAFHWFDVVKTRRECLRVLKQDAWVALLFNERLVEGSPFLIGYESILQRYATDYNLVNHANLNDDTFVRFYGTNAYERRSFPNIQRFDYKGLEGRLLSSSYAPAKGHPDHEPMLSELRQLFDRTEKDGFVSFDYQTLVYMGRLA